MSKKIIDFFAPTAKRARTDDESPSTSTAQRQLPVSAPLTVDTTIAAVQQPSAPTPITPESCLDIADYVGQRLSNSQKKELCQRLWKPTSEYKFPSTTRANRQKEQPRSLNIGHFERFPWLCFSHKQKAAFCFACVLFDPLEGQSKTLVKQGLTKFTKLTSAGGKLTGHDDLGYHHTAMFKLNLFKENLASGRDISDMVQSDHALTVAENRRRLKVIIETVELCGRAGIALRGHRDDGLLNPPPASESESIVAKQGNFRRLLQYRINGGDTILKEHLDTAGKNATYISKTVQNELIDIMGKNIVSKIIAKANDAECFSVLADETPDVSHLEQLSISIRFVNQNSVEEGFLKFVDIPDQSANTISSVILQTLEESGLDLFKLVGQGYDGAAAMSGIRGGVQAIIKQKYPLAIYTHCSAHCLNLVLAKACSIPEARRTFAFLNDLYGFLTNSTKRAAEFRVFVENFAGDNVRKRKLVSLCETRWASRHNSIAALIQLFQPVILYLEHIAQTETKEDVTNKVKSIYNSLKSSELVVTLCMLNRVFEVTETLSKLLQSETMDIIAALKEVDFVSDWISDSLRKSEDGIKKIVEEANTMARFTNGHDIHTPFVRGQDMSESLEAFYNRKLYTPFLSHVAGDLDRRFEQHRATTESLGCLIPKIIYMKRWADVEPAFDFCEPLFPLTNKFAMEREFDKWKIFWVDASRSAADDVDLPDSALAALDQCSKKSYPMMNVLLQVLATLPVSTATSERSFSTIKRLKTYLRSTMVEERLSGLATMSIHQNVPIDYNQVLDVFATGAARRMDIVL